MPEPPTYDYPEMAARRARFIASCRRIEEPDIDAVYDRRWVAAHDGQIVTWADSLDGLCDAVDAMGLPRGECQFRYVGAPEVSTFYFRGMT